MILRKFAVCCLIIFLVLSVMFYKERSYIATQSTYEPAPRITVVLDAGHGGFDGGAEADDGTLEKDLNLCVAKKLEALLLQGGFDVVMMRDEDKGLENNAEDSISSKKISDMKRRLEIINSNPDALFVSIHMNKFTTASPSGAQVFYSANNQNSLSLAENVQQSIKNLLQSENKRVVKQADKSIYLLYNAQIPAVIVECGFLSNQTELNNLKNDSYQTKLALAIYCGMLEYYS